MNYDIENLIERRDRLIELKKKEPNNPYNNWDSKISNIEQKIELAETYQQGRTDAIDEFTQMLKNEWTIDSILSTTDKYNLIAIFKRIAEQLKEH